LVDERRLLVEGQGNLARIDGDPPAAMRSRNRVLAKLSTRLLEDIDKGKLSTFRTLTIPLAVNRKWFAGRFPKPCWSSAAAFAWLRRQTFPPHNLVEVIQCCMRPSWDNPGDEASGN